MNYFKNFISFLITTLSLWSSIAFGQDWPTVIIQGDINEKTSYTNSNVIINGETLTVNADLELTDCKVTINTSNILGKKKIKIHNEVLYEVVFTSDVISISATLEIKNANTVILSSQLNTQNHSHLKFENGSLVCHNSTWNLDGHVDFQAHNSFIDSLSVAMNNVAINELSNQIHYKKDVSWQFEGGCISPYQKEQVNEMGNDERPEGYTDCHLLSDSLNYFVGELKLGLKTNLEWSMFSEENIDSYSIYTSNDRNNWTLITQIEATNPETPAPVSYTYSDLQTRNGLVYFKLSSFSNGTEIELDTLSIVYNEDLPVEMIYFESEVFEEGISLFWATATEVNSSHFEVEYSTNNSDWIKIAEVQSAGNSNATIEYQYDDILRYGSTYYRLKQVDLDGKYEYFGPTSVYVQEQNEAEVVVFPVPQSAGMDINIQINNDTPYDLFIFNHIGQLVYQNTDLQHTTTLSTPWGRGVFIVHIIQGKNKLIKKFQLN
ncbi:T9SS type A sorting domain-containing protein [Flammeovirga sp. SJP92]|uniref:T9SS type A sorting domain-containing protein n=1 Tax=Flammeovirga sp. SJP92 TaxID=1775430 RepID=UPI000787C8E2|nr:T9SS type A sorting domain-containing protein [Flammeovirga sp. SJP92]KXX66831.1 hypothetical protein AVL50_30325 [Flammeovirga sp. SJP92]